MESNAVSGHEDDDAGSSGDEVDSAELLLNNGSVLSAEENEDKTASLTKPSLLKCLQSLWHNRKDVASSCGNAVYSNTFNHSKQSTINYKR